jgi:hypothetical protein
MAMLTFSALASSCASRAAASSLGLGESLSRQRIVDSNRLEQVNEETDQQENEDHEEDESNRIVPQDGLAGEPKRLARSDAAAVNEQYHQDDNQQRNRRDHFVACFKALGASVGNSSLRSRDP